MAKYLLLKHYRGGPERSPQGCIPMDQWTPQEISDHIGFMHHVADERCGNVFTTGFFVDLLGGLGTINSDSAVMRVPKNLPIHLVSGSLDPVGAKGKGVQQVADQYRRLGVQDVSVKLWPEARHEVLNETNRDEVMDSVVEWLDAHVPQG